LGGQLVAPFPYFGGKRRVARVVWDRFGDVTNYVEPFAGSLAVALGRPEDHVRKIETVNDSDGLLMNFWRAVTADPDSVAAWADWPVSEADLHARHLWLLERKPDLVDRLCGDPYFFDPQAAGWWVWGCCAWIGSGWCSGNGPWVSVDGVMTRAGDAGVGVNRQLPHLGNAGRGVNRQLPHLGDAGVAVRVWFEQLSVRLRRTRITCGDWARVVTPSVTTRHGLTGVFLDPPYSGEIKQTRVYAHDDDTVAHQVRAWCTTHGDDPQYRIALCGYAGEGHEALEDAGWSVYAWKTRGGYSAQNSTGAGNAHRERIWFSPHCLTVEVRG